MGYIQVLSYCVAVAMFYVYKDTRRERRFDTSLVSYMAKRNLKKYSKVKVILNNRKQYE